LDTGSGLSYINPMAVSKIPNVKINSINGPIVKLANGNLLQITKNIIVEIDYYDEEFDITLFIFPDLLHEIVLGLDFCHRANLSIEFVNDMVLTHFNKIDIDNVSEKYD
jgi:hypothetical protein